MPKRGGSKGGRQWQQNDGQRYNGKYNDDHDDRTGDRRGGDIKRRVSFKPASGGRYGPNNRRVNEISIRAHLDDNVDMTDYGVSGSDNRGTFRGRGNRKMRRNSPPPRGGSGRRKLIPGASGWFQVTIPYGHKYEKEFILKSLLHSISPDIFIPHYFKIDQTAATFYVDDLQMAESLLNADRRVIMPDGFKMVVKVRNSIPQVQVDATLKERMKMAMVKRYSVATKALDLTKFHSDPELSDIFCALFRPTIMLAAIDILAENIPDLEALNLSENKIHLLDHFKCLQTKLPNLKILHMAKNKIITATSLDALKGLPIIDLVLEDNPIKDRIKDHTSYVSEIRKRFPKLIKLDGVDLPPAIGFDVVENIKLPLPKASFLCDSSGADIVRQFLEQYFIIFDSENRLPLLEAYHEHAMFSLTATYSNQHGQRLSSYLSHNRNNLRIKDLDGRCRHLKNGRLPVVSFLSELPSTQHDPQSFGVDLTLFTPQLILLTVTGIFKEKPPNSVTQPLRSFQRSLVIVPSGSGFCIRNEMIHITNVTQLQEQNAFKVQAPSTTTAIITPSSIVTSPQATQINSPSNNVAVSDATRLQMVQTMSAQSNMNLEWSKKCLEETNWDFQRAAYIFTELQKQNKIPAEAFLK